MNIAVCIKRVPDSETRVKIGADGKSLDEAGGARARDEPARLCPGRGAYVLRYNSDGSHSHADWNDDPPDDPESWGITVFRMGTR
jgi:hypothetical protein